MVKCGKVSWLSSEVSRFYIFRKVGISFMDVEPYDLH